MRSENLHAGNQTFRARSREPFQALGIVPFAEKKLCVEGQFGLIRAVSFVGIKVCYCHSLWQEIHLSVQINSPEKSNIEQQVCRLACDDPTEHGRAEHVCDYVVLVLRCFELSPVHCSLFALRSGFLLIARTDEDSWPQRTKSQPRRDMRRHRS